MGNYRSGGTWYPGSIMTVHAYGGYDIHYDDNDIERKVPPDCIRCQDESVTLWDQGAYYDNSKASIQGARVISVTRKERNGAFVIAPKREFTPCVSRTNRAVMKIFFLLALQVASSMQRMSASIHKSEMLATAGLKMSKTAISTPTLGKSVLDIIFVHLLTISEALANKTSSAKYGENISGKTGKCNSDTGSVYLGERGRKSNEDVIDGQLNIRCAKVPDDVLAMLCEVCALLSTLSGHPKCKPLLCRPKWVALLLLIVVACPRKCKEYSLCILQDMLPQVAPSDLIDDSQVFTTLRGAISDKVPVVGTNSLSVTIVKVLLASIGEYGIASLGPDAKGSTFSQTISLVLESSEDMAEVYAGEYSTIAESVALVRALMASETWRGVVDKVLVEGLQDLSTYAKLQLTPAPSLSKESPVISKSLSGKETNKDNLCRSFAPLAMHMGLLGVLGGLWEGFYENGRILVRSHSGAGAESSLSSPLGASSAAKTDSLSPYYVLRSFISADTFQYEAMGPGGEVLQEGLKCNVDAAEPVSRFPVCEMNISDDVLQVLLSLCGVMLRINPVYSPPRTTESPEGKVRENTSPLSNRNYMSALACFSCRALTCILAVPSIADKAVEILTDSSSDGQLSITFMRAAAAVSNSGGLMDIPVYENYSNLLMKMSRKALIRESLDSASKSNDASRADKDVKEKAEPDMAIEVPPANQCPNNAVAEVNAMQFEENRSAATSHVPRSTTDLPEFPAEAEFLANPEMQELLGQLVDMGFTRPICEIALQACDGDLDEALNYILSNGNDLEGLVGGGTIPNEEGAADAGPAAAAGIGAGFGAFVDDDGSEEDSDSNSSIIDGYGSQEELLGSRNNQGGARDNNGNQARESFQRVEPAYSLIDTRIDPESPRTFHYTTRQRILLPFYAEPSIDSDRLGGLVPGDDITVIGRFIERLSTDKSQVWLEASVDYFDGHFFDVEEHVDSSDEEDEDEYDRDNQFSSDNSSRTDSAIPESIWIPALNPNDLNQELIIEGPNEGGESMEDLQDPPCPLFPVEATYRVVGNKGAIVRESPELSSSQVTLLQKGTVVRVVGETLNSDAKVRLRIVGPVQGWISKLKGLVRRVSGGTTGSEKAGNNMAVDRRGLSEASSQKLTSDWRTLEEIDDELEHWGGGEIFRREDRLFGSLQGLNIFKDSIALLDQI